MASKGYKLDVAQFGCKKESTEGTAIAITKSEATMLARNLSYSSDIPFHEMNCVSATHAQFTGVSGGPRTATLSAEFPIKGSGAAGTAPALDPVWESIGLLGVNDPGVSEIYKDTVHGTAMTCAWWVAADVTNGLKHIVHGARSSGEIILNTGEIPIVRADIQGVWNLPAQAVMLADVVYETTVSQDILGGAFTLDGLNLKYRSCSINIENEMAARPDPSEATGVYSVLIAKQRITCTMDIEAEDPGTWDAFTEMTTDQEWAFSLVVGGTVGNICTITAPKVQLKSIDVGDRDGILTHELELAFNRSGNSSPYAISIAFT